jgi:TonB family protein
MVTPAALTKRAILTLPPPAEQVVESVELTGLPEQLLVESNLLQQLQALRGSAYSPELKLHMQEIVVANDGLKLSANGWEFHSRFRIVSVSLRDGSQAERVVLQVRLGLGNSDSLVRPGRPSDFFERDSAIQPISTIDANYPAIARQNRVQGDVVVEGRINPNGKLEDIRVISGHAFLVDAALEALRQWIYPTESAGRTTRATVAFVLAAQ